MRAVRVAALLAGATVLAVAAVVGALWLWSGAGTSLATTLAVAAQWLPAGQSLQSRNVQGSLQSGGTIGWVRWQRGPLSIEAHDVAVNWSWRSALQGEARVDQLSARLVHIEDTSPSSPGPTLPPTDLALPLKVDTQWAIGTLEWRGSAPVTATDLSGHYVFDGTTHRLQETVGRIGAGNYQLAAQLQAQAPMALSMQAQGSVTTSLPGRSTALEVAARASVAGGLAGHDATLEVSASLVPGKETPMGATMTAQLQPWKSQPVVQGHARWQALDLSALWPQAPQARLTGEAHVTPTSTVGTHALGWSAELQVSNSLSGPWDQQRLPLEQLSAQLQYQLGQWTVRSLRARGAGGQLEAEGQLHADVPASGWIGKATVVGINPAALHTHLASTVLDGALTARHTDAGVVFDASLQGHANRFTTGTGPLQLQRLRAHGTWTAPLLQLDTVSVLTDDAQLEGKLTVHTARPLAIALDQLDLKMPGATAQAKGQLSALAGEGNLQMHMGDAALARRWLSRVPGAPAALAQMQWKGEAHLDGHWQGGWQALAASGTAPSQTPLQLQMRLRVPQLEVADSGPGATPWRVRDGQLDLDGPLQALSLRSQGQLERAQQRASWNATAQAGLQDNSSWQARLETAQLSVSDAARPSPWSLQLGEPVVGRLERTASSTSLSASAGFLRLNGPLPGTAVLRWQPLQWSRSGAHMQARTRWETQGSLTDVPLAWLEVFSPRRLADMGVRGDVVLGGQWEVSSGDSLRVRAVVERTAGDLQLLGESDGSTLLSAGVRTARVELSNNGEMLNASLRWESERAGQIQASAGTRLQWQTDQWVWAKDAPLSGQVKAQLPRVGAWSVLAPPGWRLRGTLDADAMLSGTRERPLWRGHLHASDLALRSVVDGVDFSGGVLRTRLEGERLDILEFRLQGAGSGNDPSNAGGQLTATGFVQWQAPDGASANPAIPVWQHLRMELDATAKALRVSARSDRRLVLSGTLNARQSGAQLVLRGKLKADQALFVMPEESTPRLGDDVTVRTSVVAAPQPAVVRPASPPQSGTPLQPDVAISLDLGSDFQVRGSGLVTLLEGSVELTSTDKSLSPRLNGTLRTSQGTYKAYGQQLDIEEGVLRFSGPYDNPSLDILAIRPNLTQRVGVQISGTALLPVVRLYADPDLADSEKLAWLLLGRSGANGGAEAAMLQQAALALLGKKDGGISGGLADAFGLDEISLRGGTNGETSSANSTTSTGTATGATVTLGKRLSRDFYVAYERSLAGTVGTLSIFYDLSRRFTLRAQTGEQSAVDLIFTLRYD